MTDERRAARPYTPQPLPDGETLCRLARETDAFACHQSDGLRALDYTHVTGDARQFDHPFCEMRGLIVDDAGHVAARPFHKFFSWHERGGAVHSSPWDGPCEITRKVGGWLLFPARHGTGAYSWCTRGGRTDIAKVAGEWFSQGLGIADRTLLNWLLAWTTIDPLDGAACTPLFQFRTPGTRADGTHGERSLTLVGVRRNVDGTYWTHERVHDTFEAAQGIGASDRVRLVERIHAGRRTTARLAAARRGSRSDEGCVVAFPSGHRIKVHRISTQD